MFDYTYFMEQLNEITKVIGISDNQISEANGEKREIETKNATIKLKLNMCIGGTNYVETEEDYWLGFDETKNSGYETGYSDAQSGSDNSTSSPYGTCVLYENRTKKGYENGRRDGYCDGYAQGRVAFLNP